MTDFIPKPAPGKVGGLGPKAQKLQALREKAEQQKSGSKHAAAGTGSGPKARELAGTKKTSFQRKAT